MARKTFIEKLGALPFKKDLRDYKLSKQVEEAKLPESFELEMCEVKNQGIVGSCVAHAIASTIEYHNKVQENINKKISTGFIYGNRRNSSDKTSGMYVRDALSNVCKYGDVFYSDFKENAEVPDAINLFEERFDSLKDKAYPNRFSTYFRALSEREIKYCLVTYGPVVFSMNWYSDITLDENNVINTTQKCKNKTGGHCMVIYGWNEKGWLIQNSWGKYWGKYGKAILPYNIKLNEAWGVTDEVTSEMPDVIKPIYNTTFLRIIVKILNFIINLFK